MRSDEQCRSHLGKGCAGVAFGGTKQMEEDER